MADGEGQQSLIDRSMKRLIRRVPPAFFWLAGVDVDPGLIYPEDVSVNLPEFRADQVFVVGESGDPDRWALHLEYQLQPDGRVLRGWFLKNAGLTAQLEMDVVLVAVYLTRGSYATFPDHRTVSKGGLTNAYRFHTIRLWEHAFRIRGGELPELAPLLVLCEDNPTEQTLREERELIIGLEIDSKVKTELLALAVTVGARYFPRELVFTLFQEEIQMLKEATFIEERVSEAAAERSREAEQRGLAQGRTEGRAEGRAETAREILLRLLGRRFGELPAEVVSRVESESPEWCEATAERVLEAESLEELGL